MAPLQPCQGWAGAPTSYNPPLEGAFFIPEVARIDLLALDSTDDQTLNYDTVLIQPDAYGEANIDAADALTLETGEWGSLMLSPDRAAGADFLLQEITPERLTLYHTGVYHNTASPRALLEGLNEQFGFFPAPADDYALEKGWINYDDFLFMLERTSRWRGQVAAWVMATYQPDLLVTWQDEIDQAAHVFLLVDERQPGYTAERASQSAAYLNQAVQLVDQSVGLLLDTVDLSKTAVFLTADHGLAPVHTTVYVNTLLERAGLLILDRRDYVDTKRSKAFAVASGGAVHIYINLQGRQRDGTLPVDEYETVQSQVVDLLRQASDPSTSAPLFARVLPRNELANLRLDHGNSGDVFAQAAPGYLLDDTRGKQVLLEPASYYGGHGYDSNSTEMQAFFIASGAGIPNHTTPVPAIQLVDIAPTIAALLGFPPAGSVEGAPVTAIIKP